MSPMQESCSGYLVFLLVPRSLMGMCSSVPFPRSLMIIWPISPNNPQTLNKYYPPFSLNYAQSLHYCSFLCQRTIVNILWHRLGGTTSRTMLHWRNYPHLNSHIHTWSFFSAQASCSPLWVMNIHKIVIFFLTLGNVPPNTVPIDNT